MASKTASDLKKRFFERLAQDVYNGEWSNSNFSEKASFSDIEDYFKDFLKLVEVTVSERISKELSK